MGAPTELVKVVGIAAAWQKVVDGVGRHRRGQFRGPELAPIQAEVAFSDTPAADEITVLSATPIEIFIPSRDELWARVRDGGAGATEVHGTLQADYVQD